MDVKPCMNDGCIENSDNLSAYNCSKFCTMEVDLCSKYTDTPPPKPFTPKNPDDYIPGCKNEGCRFFNKLLVCNCIKTDENYDEYPTHDWMCKRVPCYDPAPKPKTRQVAVVVVKLEEKHMNGKNLSDIMDVLDSHGYNAESAKLEIREIITEEV